MYPVSSEGLNKETDKAVFFFTPAFHVFDNFSAHTIELWGERFPTAEHAFQWKKFSQTRPDIAAEVIKANSPEAVKRISGGNKQDIPANWHDVKVSVMEDILRAKLTQNLDVQEQLKKTGVRDIIENSPVDSFWGCGQSGGGKNTMGKLWMKLREELK